MENRRRSEGDRRMVSRRWSAEGDHLKASRRRSCDIEAACDMRMYLVFVDSAKFVFYEKRLKLGQTGAGAVTVM
jgi:hypothetical protein